MASGAVAVTAAPRRASGSTARPSWTADAGRRRHGVREQDGSRRARAVRYPQLGIALRAADGELPG
jgi:hypothetical protein